MLTCLLYTNVLLFSLQALVSTLEFAEFPEAQALRHQKPVSGIETETPNDQNQCAMNTKNEYAKCECQMNTKNENQMCKCKMNMQNEYAKCEHQMKTQNEYTCPWKVNTLYENAKCERKTSKDYANTAVFPEPSSTVSAKRSHTVSTEHSCSQSLSAPQAQTVSPKRSRSVSTERAPGRVVPALISRLKETGATPLCKQNVYAKRTSVTPSGVRSGSLSDQPSPLQSKRVCTVSPERGRSTVAPSVIKVCESGAAPSCKENMYSKPTYVAPSVSRRNEPSDVTCHTRDVPRKPAASVVPQVINKSKSTGASPSVTLHVTLGHMHQGNYIFSDFSRGRFCLAAAVVAIHKLQMLEKPTSQDIDEILYEGDVLYRKLKNVIRQQHGSFGDMYLAFSDLPALIETTNEQFICDLNDSDALFGTCFNTDMENLSLSEALQKAFESHNAALIICAGQAFSVFLDCSGQFCYFDSHSRNVIGEQSSEGTAIIMRFPTLHQLQSQIFRLVRSLGNEGGSMRYELQPLQIHRSDEIDTVSRVCTTDSALHFDEDHINITFQRSIPRKTTNVKCSNTFSVLTDDNFDKEATSDKICESVSEEKNTVHENSNEADSAKTFVCIVQASVSQTDSGFSQHDKYKLSISNAVMSLICLNSQSDIQSSDVTYVLLEGARLCDKYTPKISPSNLKSAIPKLLSLIDRMYTVETMESFEGILGNVARTRSQKHTNPLEGLTNAFRVSDTVIIAIGKYVFSAFKAHDGLYGIFNSNPCNSHGIPTHDGKSTLLFCNTVQQVHNTIEQIAKHASKSVRCYHIMSIKIAKNQTPIANLPLHTEPFSVPDISQTHTNHSTECPQPKFYKREYMKQYMAKRRRQSDVQNRDKEYIKQQRLDPEFHESEREACRHRYVNNEISHQADLLRSRTKYSGNESFRENVKAYSSSKYQERPGFRADVKAYSSSKYQERPGFRADVKAYSSSKYQERPGFRADVKAYSSSKYRERPGFRADVKAYSSSKYRERPGFRADVKAYSSSKYQQNAHFRLQCARARKLKYNSNNQFRDRQRERRKLNYVKYTTDPSLHKRLKGMRRRQYLRNIQSHRKKVCERQKKLEQQRRRMENVKKQFATDIQEYPEYVCCVCHHLLFKKQCIKCDKMKYSGVRRLSNLCISEHFLHRCNTNCAAACPVRKNSRSNLYICHTCHRHLAKGKMSPEAYANGLQLHALPQEVQTLNTLEKHLISRMVPFMKVIRLPKGGQQKLKGPCVMVPSDLQNTLTTLPRCDTDNPQIIKLKMKRKLTYRGHYDYRQVNMKKVYDVLHYLKDEVKSVHYEDIHIDDTVGPLPNEMPTNSGNIETPDTQHEEQVLLAGPNNLSEGILMDHDESELHSQTTSTDPAQPDVNNERTDETEIPEDTPAGPVLDTFLMPVDMIQEALPFCPDSILSIAPCEGNKPTNMFLDKRCEALSFPNHFPDGKNTLTEQRPHKLLPSKYFQARLMNVDTRFASDPQYIFFAHYLTELNFISSNISIALRKGKKNTKDGRRITANTLSQRQGVDHVTREDTGFRHFPTLKGSPDYWRKTQHDLFAMVRQLGIPTFFCSFSCNNDWPEIVTAIKAQQGQNVDVSTLSWEEKCTILASNPVTCARMFDHRVKLFLNTVIRSPANPIGEVLDWFYRVEWQARGSPHIHCLFWIKDAPVLGKDSDQAVCDFVDQYVSCQIPSENEELHDKVSRFQTHSRNHTKSCKKGNRPCRFNYPRPVAKRTFISRPISKTDEHAPSENEVKLARTQLSAVWDILNGRLEDESMCTDELLQKAGMTWETYKHLYTIATNKLSVIMKRDPKDSWTNNHSPALLDIWNANMDIQYITDPYSCIMYILSYISKAEHELSEILRNAQQEIREGNYDLKSEMKKLGNVYLDYREISCQEAAHRMCNLHLKECSRAVVALPTDENPTRLSLPLSQIQAKARENEDTDDIWMTNLTDKYQARPDAPEFDNMCLAQFASEFRIVYGQTNSQKAYKLKDNRGTIQQRREKNFAVIRYPRHSKTSKPEEYYQCQLKAYLPWRYQCQLKPRGYATYEEFHDAASIRLSDSPEVTPVKIIVAENRSLYEKNAEVLHDAWDTLQSCGSLEDAWATIAEQAEADRLEADKESRSFDSAIDEPLADDHDYLDRQFPEQIPGGLAVEHNDVECLTRSVRPLLKCMNVRQQQVFYTIRKWCLDKVNGLNPEPFHIFLSGAAGVGKSLLIKCIYYEATKILLQHQTDQNLSPVFLSATTGLAAFNIGGSTIHSLLKIIKPRKGTYIGLSENMLNTMNTFLSEMKILIIDEISMMGSQILEYVHKRLGQLKHSKNLFGDICILAVGDFYQLPPVRAGLPICAPNNCDLWIDNFQFVELTEIMRQRDDATFAELLNRLRVRSKNESLTASDTDTLLARVTALENCPQDALFIFAKNKEVDEHNEKMLQEKCTDISAILAVDVVRNKKTGNLEQRQASISNTKTDSLPSRLRIAIGARVMITKNVDTEHGITNGATGMVTAILATQEGKLLPEGICVQFDNEKVGRGLTEKNRNTPIPFGSVKIKPFEESLDPIEQERKGGIRRQFPLRLSWACTIHKVQGLTVEKIVISMKSMFESGHAYVAFSRVTNLQGLHLLDFHADKIYRNEAVARGLCKMKPLQLSDAVEHSATRFTVIHHNVEGLLQNLEGLQNHYQLLKCDILLLTETWLAYRDDLSKLHHQDFDLVSKSRRESYNIESMASLAKGGVAMYIRKNVPRQFVEFSVSNLEFLAIRLNTHQAPLIVCVIYRPARYATGLFCHALQQLVLQFERETTPDTGFIVTGDFNEDLLKGQHAISTMMIRNGYSQAITQSTTLANTLLDAVYIKNVNMMNSGVLQTFYSYHDAVFVQI